MITYVLVNSEWVEGEPTQGQKFRKVFADGREIVSFYSEPELPTANTKMTRIKFKQRMTQAERIAVRNAGKVDDIIYDFMDLVSEATYIDLSLPETIGGVQYLEAQGHLATGRADEIINTPVTQEEAYNESR